MKLKIVQPEAVKKDEDVIEFYLKYDTYGNVCLISNRGGNTHEELWINDQLSIVVPMKTLQVNTQPLRKDSNLESITLL